MEKVRTAAASLKRRCLKADLDIHLDEAVTMQIPDEKRKLTKAGFIFE
jgi:hypothetical protein